MRLILNVLWLVLSGFWMCLGYLFFGVLWCITVIGIPFGIANFKMVPVAFAPLGRDIVDARDLDAAYAAYRQQPTGSH